MADRIAPDFTIRMELIGRDKLTSLFGVSYRATQPRRFLSWPKIAQRPSGFRLDCTRMSMTSPSSSTGASLILAANPNRDEQFVELTG